MASHDVFALAMTPPGREVEVRTHFDGRWTAGFEVAAVNRDGYLVRRRSDGSVLPTAFRVADIRPRRVR